MSISRRERAEQREYIQGWRDEALEQLRQLGANEDVLRCAAHYLAPETHHVDMRYWQGVHDLATDLLHTHQGLLTDEVYHLVERYRDQASQKLGQRRGGQVTTPSWLRTEWPQAGGRRRE